MRSNDDGTRQIPDGHTTTLYLAEALDLQWRSDIDFLRNRLDLERVWSLQNELRQMVGLSPLDRKELTDACSRLDP